MAVVAPVPPASAGVEADAAGIAGGRNVGCGDDLVVTAVLVRVAELVDETVAAASVRLK